MPFMSPNPTTSVSLRAKAAAGLLLALVALISVVPLLVAVLPLPEEVEVLELLPQALKERMPASSSEAIAMLFFLFIKDHLSFL